MQRVSGLETWFSLPGRTAPAPPKWKMATVTILAIIPLVLLMNVRCCRCSRAGHSSCGSSSSPGR